MKPIIVTALLIMGFSSAQAHILDEIYDKESTPAQDIYELAQDNKRSCTSFIMHNNSIVQDDWIILKAPLAQILTIDVELSTNDHQQLHITQQIEFTANKNLSISFTTTGGYGANCIDNDDGTEYCWEDNYWTDAYSLNLRVIRQGTDAGKIIGRIIKHKDENSGPAGGEIDSYLVCQ